MSVAPPPGTRSRLVLVAAAAALVFGVSVESVVGRGRSAAESSALDRVPTAARERWTVTLDATFVYLVAGTPSTIVAAVGWEPMLVALDADSGIERWRAPGPGRSLIALEVLDGVVVAHADHAYGNESLSGFDVRSGRQLWSNVIPVDRDARISDEQIVVVRPGTMAEAFSAIELIEPSTGDRRALIEGDAIRTSFTSVQRREGDVVEAYDLRSFELRARVDLSDVKLRSSPRSHVVRTGAGVVVVTPTTALLLDATGSTLLSSVQLSVPTGSGEWFLLDDLDGSGRWLILQRRRGITMLAVSDGGLRELWTRPASVLDWLVTDDQHLVAVVPHGDDPDHVGTAGLPMQIIDAATGGSVWEGPRALRTFDPTPRILAANGFVTVVPDPQRGTPTEVAAYGLDGMRLWRHPVDEDTEIRLVDSALLTVRVDRADDRLTLSLLS